MDTILPCRNFSTPLLSPVTPAQGSSSKPPTTPPPTLRPRYQTHVTAIMASVCSPSSFGLLFSYQCPTSGAMAPGTSSDSPFPGVPWTHLEKQAIESQLRPQEHWTQCPSCQFSFQWGPNCQGAAQPDQAVLDGRLGHMPSWGIVFPAGCAPSHASPPWLL